MRTQAMSWVVAALSLALGGCAPQQTPLRVPAGATADNSRTSLDWAGVYQGVLPCADCEGIETLITLNKDATYIVKTRYLGRDNGVFERQGAFAWDEAGGAIRLAGMSDGPEHYLVGEGVLIQLDREGHRITGDLAPRYVLRKTADSASAPPELLTSPSSWKLTELGGRPVSPRAQDEQEVFLVFEKEWNGIHGFAGCNRFHGKCDYWPGNRVRISNVAVTKMACPDLATEAAFLQVLENADNYFTDGKVLKLHRAKMAPLAVFEAVSGEQE